MVRIPFKPEFFQAFFSQLLKLRSNCEDLSSVWSFIGVVQNICFIYLHLFIHPSRVYYEVTIWPAPSWLDSSVGRALHRHRRGHGFESRSNLNFFQAFFSQLLKLRSNCEDLSSIWSFIHSSKCICFIYSHLFIHPSRVYHELTIWPAPSWRDSSVGRALHRHRRSHGSNPVQAWIFFRLSLCNCLSCVVTARIFLLFDLSFAVQTVFHIFTFIIHASRVYYELTIWPAAGWLDSSVGRALHWHRRSHGFESRSSLNFFQAFFSFMVHLFHTIYTTLT